MKIPFSVTATTAGQTLFGPITIPSPAGKVNVQGVAQDQLNGDFTITGSIYITLATGIPLGQRVFGEIEL